MEDSIMLHTSKDIFKSANKETSDSLGIRDFFIEKDYWISMVLKRLSKSKYSDSVVFKGGTSLSKGFRLINRFSEDVDLAILKTSEMSGNQLKTLIRNVEKEITQDLEEIKVKGTTSKGSRFRKSVYLFPEIQKMKSKESSSNSIIVEINSFANPYPYIKVSIQSMIGEYLQINNQNDIIKKFGLEAFKINVLDKNQTMIEKLVSLIRFSFSENPIGSISSKIRHFYDLYFLMNDSEFKIYFNSDKFLIDFKEVLEHDRKIFNEPPGWNKNQLKDSPLINDFDNLWSKLKKVYYKELSMLAFTEIPKESDIARNFRRVISVLDVLE